MAGMKRQVHMALHLALLAHRNIDRSRIAKLVATIDLNDPLWLEHQTRVREDIAALTMSGVRTEDPAFVVAAMQLYRAMPERDPFQARMMAGRNRKKEARP